MKPNKKPTQKPNKKSNKKKYSKSKPKTIRTKTRDVFKYMHDMKDIRDLQECEDYFMGYCDNCGDRSSMIHKSKSGLLLCEICDEIGVTLW